VASNNYALEKEEYLMERKAKLVGELPIEVEGYYAS
jgi:hypothetical protein